MIGQEELQNLREQVDIVDVISSYIPLTQKGRNFFGVCPFHDDNHPSMSVSREKQIYTCFACGASGNVFKFIMDYEHVSFREAVSKVATIAGVEMNLHLPTHQTTSKYQKLYDCYSFASKLYQNNLHTKLGQGALEYLKKRQIDDDCIKEFGIDEQEFLAKLDEMVELAFDDQCTGANPRYPLFEEIKQMYLDAYYGRI